MGLYNSAWTCSVLFWTIITQLDNVSSGRFHRADKTDKWKIEALGQIDTLDPDAMARSEAEVDVYKKNLLQYVLQADEPRQVSSNYRVPYIMKKLYGLLADKSTGREKRSAPFEVDLIRGLEDYYETERRMQFWFNVTSVNETEDVIETYFHIYKKSSTSLDLSDLHTVTVSLYKITDETEMFAANGSVGPGSILLDQQEVSAYTGQWIVFRSGLNDTVKEWIKHPNRNKGLLLTATDSNNKHVNGTHIDFTQRGESPESEQPVFVLYTDQEKRKSSKHKRRHRKNIDYLIQNFLNEDSRTLRNNRKKCEELLGSDNPQTTEDCTHLLLRHRRSTIDDSVDIESEVIQTIERGSSKKQSKRRLRRRHDKQRYLDGNRREHDFCQVKPLYISFQALGWGKWIIAPEGLNANFCEGSCPFPLTSTLTSSNHAVLQSVSSYYLPQKVKAPCCVPQNLDRMTILYHHEEKIVTMRNYDNMMVKTCGCR
ncbi:bone morphogenetic protein 2-like [Watersipora subatra]|uniref:bone morphogenetic protein 2-like n=1 Tax=Watersipora subatra TaxID=2589382 RepID=UPI00355AE5B0